MWFWTLHRAVKLINLFQNALKLFFESLVDITLITWTFKVVKNSQVNTYKFEKKLGKSQCHHILKAIGLKLAEVLSRDKNFHLAAAVARATKAGVLSAAEEPEHCFTDSQALASTTPTTPRAPPNLMGVGETPGHSRWKNPVSGGPFIICRRNAPGQVYRGCGSLSLPLIKLCLRLQPPHPS